MSHSGTDDKAPQADFGSALAEARKTKNLTVADIRENLRIPEAVIEAIERNDVQALPTATYTQGYIRAYARFLEIDEEAQLAAFNRAVPHPQVSELKPRSSLPGEASSQSPLVKLVTMLLVLLGLFALTYVLLQYYQEKAEDIEQSQLVESPSETGSSLDAPAPGADALADEDMVAGGLADGVSAGDEPVGTFSLNPAPSVSNEPEVEEEEAAETLAPADILEIHAPAGAWLEVYDDTNARLFYNMVKQGETKTLSGSAPFRIKVGNADVTRVTLNGSLVDLSDYTRRNNTAVFTVSERNGDIVFH